MLMTRADYVSEHQRQFNLADMQMTPMTLDSVTAKFDMEITMDLTADGVDIDWLYDKTLFGSERIEQLIGHVATVLQAMAALDGNPLDTVALGRLPMLSPRENAELVDLGVEPSGQAPVAGISDCPTVHGWFEQQVARTPDAIACEFEQTRLTYGQLNGRANQLAHYLTDTCQLAPGSLVGICTERAIEMVVAVFAVLKTGCAYVPIEADYPQQRIEYVVADAGLSVVLTQQKLQSSLQQITGDSALVAIDDAALAEWPTGNIDARANGDSLAYVIYTSGSTGKPKGVKTQPSQCHSLSWPCRAPLCTRYAIERGEHRAQL